MIGYLDLVVIAAVPIAFAVVIVWIVVRRSQEMKASSRQRMK